jgi:hypothetical protein
MIILASQVVNCYDEAARLGSLPKGGASRPACRAHFVNRDATREVAMALKGPEQVFDKFLVGQPLWMRRLFEPGDLSSEEWSEFWFWRTFPCPKADFERLLKCCPTRWRKYRNRCKQLSVRLLPKGKVGRPRQDSLAGEAMKLSQKGLRPAEIARKLNLKYPNRKDCAGDADPLTAGAVRKMLSSRRATGTPEKS